jgi:CubicO group peptidase (beta-lactamase class C family)
MPNRPIDIARSAIEDAIRSRVFPGAAVEVGDRSGVVWRAAFGRLTFEPSARAVTPRTVYDLASLAKPIATASVIMKLIAARALGLETRVAECFDEWRGGDREAVTVQDLLEHAGGLAARLVDQAPTLRREFEHDICTMKLEYAPRTRSVYSDLGFILLGFTAADRGGAPLDVQWTRIAGELTDEVLGFTVPADRVDDTAPTVPLEEDARRGRVLVAEVHDNYAAALGGVAGHAGLFGTAAGVGAFGQAVLRAALGDSSCPPPLMPSIVARMTRKSTVPGSSRALGWDTMLPTSSCGSDLSPAAFGHVGFTGTSLWIDPVLDRYFVLLTNRAYATSSSDDMQRVRRAFHDAVARL